MGRKLNKREAEDYLNKQLKGYEVNIEYVVKVLKKIKGIAS